MATIDWRNPCSPALSRAREHEVAVFRHSPRHCKHKGQWRAEVPGKRTLDLAHGGRRTIKEAIAASKSPLIISHTGCAALSDLPRNVPDDLLRAMADRGGVAGIIFWPYLRRFNRWPKT